VCDWVVCYWCVVEWLSSVAFGAWSNDGLLVCDRVVRSLFVVVTMKVPLVFYLQSTKLREKSVLYWTKTRS
jgi:hypothetical protein